MGVNQSGLTPKVAPPPKQVQANQQANQASQNSQTARQAALTNANANVNTPATAGRIATAPVATGTIGGSPVGGTTAPGPAVRIGAPAPTQAGPVAAALANAFSPAFMAATGAVAVVANRKKASDVSGDAKEGEGQVGLETESEAQPDALQESNQEQGAGEITEAGSTSGPST